MYDCFVFSRRLLGSHFNLTEKSFQKSSEKENSLSLNLKYEVYHDYYYILK